MRWISNLTWNSMETQRCHAQRSDFIIQYNLLHVILFQWKCLVSRCQKSVKCSRASVEKHLIQHKLTIHEYEAEFGGPDSIDPAQGNSSVVSGTGINPTQSLTQPSTQMEQWLTDPSTNPSDMLTPPQTDSNRTHLNSGPSTHSSEMRTNGSCLPNHSGVPSNVSPSPRAWLKVPVFRHAVGQTIVNNGEFTGFG